jgi:protein TonB
MFETTLLDSVSEQSPVLTGRHRIISMFSGSTVIIAAWEMLPLIAYGAGTEATLAYSLALGAGAAAQALMICYVHAESRRLGLSRIVWLAATLAGSAAGFMAFLIHTARRTGDWRRAAMPLATTIEVAVLGVLLLIPLICTQALDLRNLPERMTPPPPPPGIRIIAVVHERSGGPVPSMAQDGRFIAPPRIPDRIADIIDAAPLPPGPDIGMPGGDRDIAGVPDGVFHSILTNASRNDPPPEISPRRAKPIERRVVGGDVQAAKLVNAPKPEYPTLAKVARVQGTVRLEAIIGTDGRVQDLQVISGHPMLVKAAMEAVSQWRYQPTLLNGVPVEVQTEINVNFILGE